MSHYSFSGRSEGSASLYVAPEDIAAYDLPPIFPPLLRKPSVGGATPRRVKSSYFDPDAARDILREYSERDNNREQMVISEDMEDQQNVGVQSSEQPHDEVIYWQTPVSNPVYEIKRPVPPRQCVQCHISVRPLTDDMRRPNPSARTLGVMFKDLKVVGIGSATNYMETFGSKFDPTVLLEKLRGPRSPPLKTILLGFEGVVRPGEMLRKACLYLINISLTILPLQSC